jgi:hypothetical protein
MLLHTAACGGNISAVTSLLAEGYDVNARSSADGRPRCIFFFRRRQGPTASHGSVCVCVCACVCVCVR